MRADFSFVTYAGLPDLDPDDRLVHDALVKRGIRADAVVWDDPSVDWSRAGICIIRSTWDYHLHLAEFDAWTERVAALTPLWNPPSLVRWNIRKTYLKELEKRGVAIVPTAWLARGQHANLAELMREHAWQDVVIKPTVGLATYGTHRVLDTSDGLRAGQKHLDRLLQQHDAMVQPYMLSVEDYGERALVFISGEFTHSVRKTAFQQLLPAGEAGETLVDAVDDEVELGMSIMHLLDHPSLYARVDVVRDGDRKARLIELELVEPSLFFSLYRPAARKFTEALCALPR